MLLHCMDELYEQVCLLSFEARLLLVDRIVTDLQETSVVDLIFEDIEAAVAPPAARVAQHTSSAIEADPESASLPPDEEAPISRLEALRKAIDLLQRS